MPHLFKVNSQLAFKFITCNKLPNLSQLLVNLLHRLRLLNNRFQCSSPRQIHSGSLPLSNNRLFNSPSSKPTKCPSPTTCWIYSRLLPHRWMPTCLPTVAVFSSLACQWASNLNRHLEAPSRRHHNVSQRTSNWHRWTLSRYSTNLSSISSWRTTVFKCLPTTLRQSMSLRCPNFRANLASRSIKSSTRELFITLDRCKWSSRFKHSNMTRLFQTSSQPLSRSNSSRCTSHLLTLAACNCSSNSSCKTWCSLSSRYKTPTLAWLRTRPSRI